MTNMKATKRALVSSVLALFLCFAMLLGTTYAWFTDEVSSANNIIQTGTLDIEMYYGNAADNLTKVDENTPAIFNYKHWEPGYTEVKYVKIVNAGSLAFKFKLDIVPNIQPADGEPNLAEVIDVYMFDPTATVGRAEIEAATPVGTLADLMAEADGAAHGVLLPAAGKGTDDYNLNENANTPAGEITYCIVLKMQEDAGNEYQNLSVGDGFSLQLMATQYTWENDSFDHTYDDGADFLETPKADVVLTDGKWIYTSTHGDDPIWANQTFQFQPTETYEEAQQSPYRYWHADFVVSADKDIAPNAIILPGYYVEYCDNYNDGKWVGLSSDETITAGTEIRLIDVLGQLLGGTVYVNYEEICNFGNDGTGFLCGVSAVDEDGDGKYDAAGTTITVELRLYETTGDPTTTSGSKNEETGEYTVIGTYSYTIPATTADQTPQP